MTGRSGILQCGYHGVKVGGGGGVQIEGTTVGCTLPPSRQRKARPEEWANSETVQEFIALNFKLTAKSRMDQRQTQ